MIILVFVLAWLLVGAALGLYEARRGHWRWLWLLGALAGPLVLPLLRGVEENESLAHPIKLSEGRGAERAGVRVLAGVDGSDESIEATRKAADLFGARLGDLTLATVATFEIHESEPGVLDPHSPWASEFTTLLEGASADLGDWLSFEPSTVLLSGQPAAALKAYAVTGGYDVIVVGSRGRGLTKRLLGSCAAQMVQGSPVPALVMPNSQSEFEHHPPLEEASGIG